MDLVSEVSPIHKYHNKERYFNIELKETVFLFMTFILSPFKRLSKLRLFKSSEDSLKIDLVKTFAVNQDRFSSFKIIGSY